MFLFPNQTRMEQNQTNSELFKSNLMCSVPSQQAQFPFCFDQVILVSICSVPLRQNTRYIPFCSLKFHFKWIRAVPFLKTSTLFCSPAFHISSFRSVSNQIGHVPLRCFVFMKIFWFVSIKVSLFPSNSPPICSIRFCSDF